MKFERLAQHHDKKSFDCGNDEINRYLQTMASQHIKKDIAKVHVLANGVSIIGFYTLSALLIDNSDNAIKGYPRQIPAILIGRMGVDVQYQGQGLSKLLLSHALNKVKAISQDVGMAFVVIDAKSDTLASYYQQFGFIPSDTPLRLMMSVKSIDFD